MLEMLITTTLFFIVFLGLRALFSKQLKPRFRYALWFLILIKLLIPVPVFRIAVDTDWMQQKLPLIYQITLGESDGDTDEDMWKGAEVGTLHDASLYADNFVHEMVSGQEKDDIQRNTGIDKDTAQGNAEGNYDTQNRSLEPETAITVNIQDGAVIEGAQGNNIEIMPGTDAIQGKKDMSGTEDIQGTETISATKDVNRMKNAQRDTENGNQETGKNIYANSSGFHVTRMQIQQILLLIWAVGCVTTTLWWMKKNKHMKKLLQTGELQQFTDYPLPVYFVKGLCSSCMFGIRYPSIYINIDNIASPEQLHFVLQHEYEHYKQKDHIWSLLRVICLSIYWFHPLVWIGARLSMADCELSCDERVVNKMDKEYRLGYAKTLVEAAGKRKRHSNDSLLAAGIMNRKENLKNRIIHIVEPKKSKRVVVLVTSLALCLTLIFSMTSYTGKAAASQDENIPGTNASDSQDTSGENGKADNQNIPGENDKADDQDDLAENDKADDLNILGENSKPDNQQNMGSNSIRQDNSSVEAQLRLIVENRSIWKTASATKLWKYAVTDLDANGRLELVSVEMNGSTRIYSNNLFWEVNENFDGLNLCQQDLAEGESQADIYYDDSAPVYYDSKQDAYMYIFSDRTLHGPGTQYEDNIRTISLKNGQISDKIRARKFTTWGNETSVKCEDGEGCLINESAYKSIYITYKYLQGKNSGMAFFHWVEPDLQGGTEFSDGELLDLLSDSYYHFSIKLSDEAIESCDHEFYYITHEEFDHAEAMPGHRLTDGRDCEVNRLCYYHNQVCCQCGEVIRSHFLMDCTFHHTITHQSGYNTQTPYDESSRCTYVKMKDLPMCQ